MSLKDKILEYPNETYIAFDEAYSNAPTNYGTIAYTGATPWFVNGPPAYNSTSNPAGASGGSWNFDFSSSTGPTRLSGDSSDWTGVGQSIHDGEYGHGVWIKINSFPTNNDVNVLYSVMRSFAFPGFAVRLSGSAYSGGVKVYSNLGGGSIGSAIIDTPQLNTWYYIVHRKNLLSNGAEIFVDGQLALTGTNPWSDASDLYGFVIGSASSVDPDEEFDFDICHWHTMKYADYTDQAIADIYAAGTAAPTNNIFTQTAATADGILTEAQISAIQNADFVHAVATANSVLVDPTVATTIGDNSYVTTSITASAEFLDNVSVFASSFVNVTSHTIMEAAAETTNNVNVSTDTGIEIVVQEFVANASLSNPSYARPPMTANGTMGDHQFVAPDTYQTRIRDLNPHLYIYDGTSDPANYGSESYTFADSGLYLKTEVDGGSPLNNNAEGLSWKVDAGDGVRDYRNRNAYLHAEPVTPANSFANIVQSAAYDFSIELWMKFEIDADGNDFGTFVTIGSDPSLDYHGVLKIGMSTSSFFISGDWFEIGQSSFTRNGSITPEQGVWYHFVLNGTPDGAGNININTYVNGAIDIANYSVNLDTTSPIPTGITFGRIPGASESLNDYAGETFDEIAFYQNTLTNSQIIDHFEYMQSLGPNFTFTATAATAHFASGDHFFGVQTNTNFPVTVATANYEMLEAQAVLPDNLFETLPMTASGQMTDPTVSVTSSVNFAAQVATAFTESGNALYINGTYSEYVISNLLPYRYVSFDGSNELLDYGSDNDYSVASTVIGGQISFPGEGINNKSVLTDGQSYVTDGVILNESEYNDDWGTGTDTYHSSFWIKRSVLDQSTTGLRVLWNLHGNLDNQHVVMFQYQNNLHVQFNNGSGTYIEQFVDNIDLFDYERHFVAIAFDHTGVNNFVNIYVDAVLVMTVDLGQYSGQTVNSETFLAPNDEANNFPRLSVGCLITPFASTALPVIPTNTRVYVDEVVWSKNELTQTDALNNYVAMPDQSQAVVLSLSIEASAEMLEPIVTLTSNIEADPMNASLELPDPSLFVVADNTLGASVFVASAEMTDAAFSESVNIASDVMIASAYTGEQRVALTVPGGPMVADAEILNNYIGGITIYGNAVGETLSNYDLVSPWAAWLRSTDVNSVYPTREVV